jgi:CRISPR-associated endonuclease Cas2
MKHQYWLVLYDIRDPHRLRKVEKIVSAYCRRIQKSVFEYHGGEYYVLDVLKSRLDAIIDETADCVIIFPICKRDWEKSEKYGVAIPDHFIRAEGV